MQQRFYVAAKTGEPLEYHLYHKDAVAFTVTDVVIVVTAVNTVNEIAGHKAYAPATAVVLKAYQGFQFLRIADVVVIATYYVPGRCQRP